MLKGKRFRGHSSPVARVTKAGGKRIVHLKNGEKIVTTKQTIREFAHGTINQTYRTKALRGLRTNPDGTANVTIGGPKEGERRTYASYQAAVSAVTRKYGPAAP